MSNELTELDALFDLYPAAAEGIAATYQALLGGVPTAAGFTYLIDTATASNYGSYRSDVVFNDENVFINLTNNLVLGNPAAHARFEALTGGATTLTGQIEAFYRALVPTEAQSAAGLAFMTRPEALQFYADAAAERGVAGVDGAAVVALASLLKILVEYDIGGLGDDVNDFIAAVGDGTALLGGDGLTDIDVADGGAHDGDEGAVDVTPPTVVISVLDPTPRIDRPTEVTFDFSEAVQGFDLSDVQVTGGTLSNLVQSADDPTVYTATFTAGSVPGPARITLYGEHHDAAGNAGAGGELGLTVLPRFGGIGNDAPTAVADAYALDEDNALTVSGPGVLGNDEDVDGDALSAVLVSGPANGTLTLNADGSFTYTPNADYHGTDSFTYRAGDGTASSGPVTVTLTVNPVNDTPVAVADVFTVDEDSVLTATGTGVLANDTDADGDPLTAVLVSGPANGTLTLNGDGTFTYTPAENYAGTDSFTYKVNDGTADGSPVTVTLTVAALNDAPVATADSYAVDEGDVLVVAGPGVLGNDTDVDGDTLTAILVTGPANGTVTLNTDGSFSYEPTAGYSGPDSFTYKVNDGTVDGDAVTVSLTVNSVNAAPEAVADNYTLDEDAVLTIGAPGVLGNDTDADGDTLTAILVTGPANGALVLNPDGSFQYTPDANYNGSDSFTYKINDGTEDGSPVTVSLTVTALNDAPVALKEIFHVNEDDTLTVAAPGLLDNDTDIDGDTLTAVLVTGPAHGTLVLNPDGSFTYTPDANYSGEDSFTYTASDGDLVSSEETVHFIVAPMNDAPVAVADSYAVDEETVLTVTGTGVLGNDTDVDGDTLTAVLVTGPANGALTLNADGTFTYTPNAGFKGSDSFTYKVNDSVIDSNTVTVSLTVNDTNAAPVAVADSYTFDEGTALAVPVATGLLANDGDADGDPLTVSLVSGAANGSLTLMSDGSFIYTPDEHFFGTDSFTYRINDGTVDGNIATVYLTVDPVNDAPVAVADSYSLNEDETLTVAAAAGVLGNDIDVEGDPLTAILVDGPTHGTLTFNSDGSFDYTPEADFSGPDSFTYKVNDGAADGNTVTVELTVNPINDAPVAVEDSYATDENQTLTIAAAAGVLANDSDANSDTLTAVLVAGPANGNLTLNADGSFSYTPTLNLGAGSIIQDSFTYKANDGTADGNTVTVNLTVTGVNDAPVSLNDVYQFDEDSTPTQAAPSVLANDYDLDGDPISASLVYAPQHGDLTFNADGTFIYTPVAGYHGTDSFTYLAYDGTANGNVATVTLIVQPLNDTPVAVGDSYSVAEDTVLTVAGPGVLGNDTDEDGDTLNAILVAGTSNGTLHLSADGSFVYTPNAGFNGADSFSYKVNDGTADGNTVTVNLTVGVPNQDPVAVADSYFLSEEGSLTIPAGGVLANDADGDSDPLTAELVSDVGNGALTLNADGSFTYVPNANFAGRDSFTYRPFDGSTYGAAVTVTLNVANTGTAHPTAIDLDDIAAGNGGFRIVGSSASALTGWSVGTIGDFDRDGRDDVIVSSLSIVPYAHVVFGAQTSPANINLGALAGIGFGIAPQRPGDQTGSVSAAGDVNGDGYADFIIGSVYNNEAGAEAGAAYVVFGGAARPTDVNLNTIAAGTGGFKIIGQNAGDRTGFSVSAAGDIDGDGYGDLLVGAIYSDAGGANSGAAYVVYGSANPVTVDLDSVSPGAGGFKLVGEASNNQAGVDVSSAGDVNGDGYDDLIVGAQYNGSGAAYVVFGTAERPTTAINLSDIAAGNGGFKIIGGGAGGLAGSSVSSAGDVDGDGYDDLIIGSPFNNNPGGSLAGAAYVVYGSATPTNVDLGVVAGGIGGFRIIGENENDWAGWSVSTAGDVNADGFDDLIVGARSNDGSGENSGAAYLIFGAAARPSVIDLDAIALGNGGFKILAQGVGDQVGISVSAAGDVNGDGFDDLMVGAYNADANGIDSGAAYVIYGGDWLV